MKKLLMLVLCAGILHAAFSQNKPAYILYNAKGKKISYQKMLKTLQQKDIVLFGEFHNNPISHWLQLEVTKDLKQTRELVLGAEMFEQDNQPALDLYLQGKLSAKGLDSMARLWKNYLTDYAPLVNFAKENKIVFCCNQCAAAICINGCQRRFPGIGYYFCKRKNMDSAIAYHLQCRTTGL